MGDDGIQCDLGGDTSTGETTDHEDEDSGNVYIEGGTLNITVTADAAKGIKADGDMKISGGDVTVKTTGGGTWDSDDNKTKASSCLSADGYMTISASKDHDQEKKDRHGKIIRQERYSGAMQRSFYVGEGVKVEDVKAKCEDGVLKLFIPKKELKQLPANNTIAIEG